GLMQGRKDSDKDWEKKQNKTNHKNNNTQVEREEQPGDHNQLMLTRCGHGLNKSLRGQCEGQPRNTVKIKSIGDKAHITEKFKDGVRRNRLLHTWL
ncbi:hypothetical protein KUCAC02_020455, partial [Chaenocephalus aceratus]